MIEKVIAFFNKPKNEGQDETPEGLCPNCLGNPAYDDTIRKLYKDKQIDVNNHNQNHSFIQQFVINRVEGITLKKGDSGLECPTYHTKAS